MSVLVEGDPTNVRSGSFDIHGNAMLQPHLQNVLVVADHDVRLGGTPWLHGFLAAGEQLSISGNADICGALQAEDRLEFPYTAGWSRPFSLWARRLNAHCVHGNPHIRYNGHDGVPGAAATGNDSHTVQVANVVPTISVDKTGPASLDEGTQTANYTVTVVNTSTVDTVSVSALVDSVFGDLDDGAAPDCVPDLVLPATLAIGDGAAGGADTLVCTFSASITGNAAETHDNTVTVTFDDPDPGGPYTDTDTHSVTFDNVVPTISVDKTGPTSLNEGTQTANYTVTVVNTSTVDTVSVSALVDSVFGDLDDGAAPDCVPDLVLPATLAIGDGLAGGADTLVCTFSASITGNAAPPTTTPSPSPSTTPTPAAPTPTPTTTASPLTTWCRRSASTRPGPPASTRAPRRPTTPSRSSTPARSTPSASAPWSTASSATSTTAPPPTASLTWSCRRPWRSATAPPAAPTPWCAPSPPPSPATRPTPTTTPSPSPSTTPTPAAPTPTPTPHRHL